MFQSIAMPNFFYVYRCTEPPLLILNVEHFLDKCYKRRYISRKLNIRELLKRSNCRTFRKSSGTNSALVKILPKRNFTSYTHAMHSSSYNGDRALQIVLCE